MNTKERDTLRQMAGGWFPLRDQLPNGRSLMNRGLIRLDWGPAFTQDSDNYVWYLTPKGRDVADAKENLP